MTLSRIFALKAGVALSLLLGAVAGPAQTSHTAVALQPDEAGPLHFSGPPEMINLLHLWQQHFAKTHPRYTFVDHLNSRETAIYGIEMRTAEIAFLDRPINPFERYGTYEHSWIFPVEIQIATDGMSGATEPATEAVFVRKDNPLNRLTVKQLDGIFGAERDGGFEKLDWNPDAARTAAGNILTWGQLGIGGTLAGKAIRPYGPASLGNGVITFFQNRVLQGGAMRAEALREYADPKAMFADLAGDPTGIAYGPIGAAPPGFKTIALSAGEGGPYVLPTAKTLADRSYPLAKPIYVYFTIDTPTGQLADPRVDPRVMAFMNYILSPAGQAMVARDGRYLPLTPAEAARQRAVLTSTEPPPERP